MSSRGVVLLALACCVIACGAPPPPWAGTAVQNYAYALAEGRYVGACALLTQQTQASLAKSGKRGASCTSVLARCLPYDPNTAKRDQSQLLYANIVVSTHRTHATATMSGPVAASAIGSVTLIKERGAWRLTSYGKSVTACLHGHHVRR